MSDENVYLQLKKRDETLQRLEQQAADAKRRLDEIDKKIADLQDFYQCGDAVQQPADTVAAT